MSLKYDYLIVGAGIFGAVFAREASDNGKRCLIIDKREHIGGNIYTELTEGIHVHKYGAHIFHTSDDEVWEYVNKFSGWNSFTHSPLACYKGELYNLPFNMNTFYRLWGVTTPAAAKAKIEETRIIIDNPRNLEEQALSLGGRDIYEKLIKAYTEKQWGRKCTELPSFIIKRLPFRFTFDNNYFNDKYQGMPANGYTALIERLLDGIEVILGKRYVRDEYSAEKIVYTGCIDEYYNYKLGALEYRSIRFEDELFECDNVQGHTVINYTSHDEPYTRKIEHRHFDRDCKSSKSIVTAEYPAPWELGDEPYYPINDDKNNALYSRYTNLAENEKNIIFGGRLGTYRYIDIDKTIKSALLAVKKEFSQKEF